MEEFLPVEAAFRTAAEGSAPIALSPVNDPGEVHLRPKITAAVRPVSTLMVGA